MSLQPFSISLMPIDRVRRTEAIDPTHAEGLAREIADLGHWTHPILVEDRVCALLDGHHRLHAARLLGLGCVPVVEIDYADPRIRLEAWRPEDAFTAERIRAVALRGELLPYKSTRHVLDTPLPRCSIPVDTLRAAGPEDAFTALAERRPDRTAKLFVHYRDLGAGIGVASGCTAILSPASSARRIPHPELRRRLEADPVVAALLPAFGGRIALGDPEGPPFVLADPDRLALAPELLAQPAALAAAARWGFEVAHARDVHALDGRRLVALVRHGTSLLDDLPAPARDAFLERVPAAVRADLRGNSAPGRPSFAWLASLVAGFAMPEAIEPDPPAIELERPLEHLLLAGGDSRLAPSPADGLNRYGVPPRPRPEAIQFSSSTASAISGHGFLYGDLLRRDLLDARLGGTRAEADIRRGATEGIVSALRELLALADDEADVAIAASGTDAEWSSVMLALAADDDRAVTNLLVSPEESGRGVAMAGAGCYFDDITAEGAAVSKGAPVWPDREIRTVAVAIRDRCGAVLPAESVDAAFLAAGRAALRAGDRVLAHVLATSKTGLCAPSLDAVHALVAESPGRVDVVVDACQLRWNPAELGALLRHGWSVQVTGSKFLTGPPFSGALLFPPRWRDRVDRVASLLDAAPGIGNPMNCSSWWCERLMRRRAVSPPSFGPLFRWVPALLEAKLLEAVPESLRDHALGRFDEAIRRRIEASASLVIAEIGAGAGAAPENDTVARRSIVCFHVVRPTANGERRPLDEPGCRALFELLNADCTGRLALDTAHEREIASRPCHIGQPVALEDGGGPVAVLRLVLGARFFNAVGHAGADRIESALASEISDALHILDKLELLVSADDGERALPAAA